MMPYDFYKNDKKPQTSQSRHQSVNVANRMRFNENLEEKIQITNSYSQKQC
jgi:hypothetical protein